MNEVIIYDKKDYDGITSAALLLIKYPKATVIGAGMEDRYDVSWASQCFLVDLPNFIITTVGDCRVYMYDHHKTNSRREDFFKCIIDSSKSSTLIVYDFELDKFKYSVNKRLIDAINVYDLWLKNDSMFYEALYLNYALFSKSVSVEYMKKLLLEIDEEVIDDLYSYGEAIVEFLVSKVNVMEGQKGILYGHNYILLFDSTEVNLYADFLLGTYDLVLVARISDDGIKLSLRSKNDTIDCSSIAQLLGRGGGHKKAGGCTMTYEQFIHKFLQ